MNMHPVISSEPAIFLIYLFYGAVFFAIGVAITSRHKTIAKLKIAGAFEFLSLFAFLHAFHEWLELFLKMSLLPEGNLLLSVSAFNLFLVFTSFLFLNAIDAMPDGGIIKVKGRPGNTGIFVSVHDQGKGISRESLDLVTEPFYTTKEIGAGTGLGLSICHGIMEIHGGSMDINSQPGQGSTIILHFPEGQNNAYYSHSG